MTLDNHIEGMGKLLGNFHSLEFILRVFLHKLPSATSSGIPYGTDMYSFPVGTEFAECALTNYDSLGQLIDKYNSQMKARCLPGIDRSIIDIRDAFAHGRVSTTDKTKPLRLLKFSKPSNGRVKMTFNQELTPDWFVSQKNRVYDAIQSVAERIDS